ncbi:MAG TPA: phosphoribosyltransferase family protein [Candidatus Paceibacterota bacterium]|jgi:predicted phosphoribosyltransferase|nr:phosphoribosyltransferase family protein [Candidatus Paceibacterota bacterium]
MFKNRHEAGILLAEKLQKYRGGDAVVLALPRGGVVVGRAVADALSLPLDIIATRKIGHPSNPEYAIGAVDAHGLSVFNEAEVASVDARWLKEETEKQMKEAKRRTSVYRKGKNPTALAGKIVIIVDDGIATGFTVRLATKVAQKEHAKKIIVAVPVAPLEAVDEIKQEGADEVILLEPPEDFFGAVGAHYQEFEQVEDQEVINLMNS